MGLTIPKQAVLSCTRKIAEPKPGSSISFCLSSFYGLPQRWGSRSVSQIKPFFLRDAFGQSVLSKHQKSNLDYLSWCYCSMVYLYENIKCQELPIFYQGLKERNPQADTSRR